MKVNSKSTQPLIHNKNLEDMKEAKSKKQKGATEAQAKSMADAAKVKLSPQAREINKAMQVANEHKTDEVKLDRLQKMIDKGEYKVDADKVWLWANAKF